MKSTNVEISLKTIFLTSGYIFSFWIIYQLRNILVVIFISFILMTAVRPLVKSARKHHFPILPMMLTIYLAVIFLLIMVIASLIPAVLEQSKAFILNTPLYLSNFEHYFNLKLDPGFGNSYLTNIPSNILRLVVGAFSNILNIFAIFFITYYLILERPLLHKYLSKFFSDGNSEKRAEAMIIATENKVGGWIRGELLLMGIIGLLTYTGLTLLGLPYALPLAVLAGLLEAVPNIGPTIAAIPAIFIGFTISPILGLGATLMSILIQQLENNLIVPRVMQSTTGTRPLVTILVLFSGYTLGGAAGAVLAMPFYLTCTTVYQHLNQ